MPSWIMKTGDNTYRVWSTVVDEWVSEPMDRDEMLEVAIGRAIENNPKAAPELMAAAGVDTMRFVDEHLCSCRARLGETTELRDGRIVTTGGGKLAYHFDSYAEVADFCRTQEERADG